MFSLFPSDWKAPKPEWMKKKEDPPSIFGDTLKPVKKIKKEFKPAISLRDLNKRVNSLIPECELCLGENNDFTEIDKLLAQMDANLENGFTDESKESQEAEILDMIKRISANLEKNIKMLETDIDTPDGISRKELVTLLKTFLESYKSVSQYLKDRSKSNRSF